jgi:hypothetical protein
MSQRFLLRAEATNLRSFVFDTSRLPTVRGGGLLLLRAPKRIEEWLQSDVRATNIKKLRGGASACVLEFEAAPEYGEEIRADLESRLGEDEALRHATFVVDLVPATENFQMDQEALLAMNRFRQMRSPSVIFPIAAGKSACAIDGIRPGAHPWVLPGEDKPRGISTSVLVRTEYGREQKQLFYREEAALEPDGDSVKLDDMLFAQDFQDLAHDKEKGRLDGKMAVLYFDGNGFGAVQEEHCKTADDAKHFDRVLQNGKRAMLRGVLEAIQGKDEGWTFGDKKKVYRLETLLWGGDEFLFVAPAWKGWWLLGEIFARLKGLSFHGAPLTFAAGMVLCQAKAPIRRMRRLAAMLAEEAKGVSRQENLAAYQVLESFDVVPGDFEAFRNRRSARQDRSLMVVAGDQVQQLAQAIEELRPLISRKGLYQLTTAVLKNSADAGALREKSCPSEPATAAWKKLEQASRSPEAAVVHLAELWDYLPIDEVAAGIGPSAPEEVAHAG